MNEHRRHDRFTLWFPMKLEIEEQASRVEVAVSRNISGSGMLVAAAQSLAVGAPVTVTFRLPGPDARERQVEGVIVRCENNDSDPEGLWPYRIAVQFDDPLTEVEELLRREAEGS